MARNSIRNRGGGKLAMGVVMTSILLGGTSGCDTAGQGALSGGALGALAGMGIGSLSGNMGKGAAAGAILGAITGLFVGDQNERNFRRSH